MNAQMTNAYPAGTIGGSPAAVAVTSSKLGPV
jgi:hypothetical protein